MSNAVKLLAIEVLDTEHGISEESYKTLQELLWEEGSPEVILNAVTINAGRCYLGEDDAEDCRKAVL